MLPRFESANVIYSVNFPPQITSPNPQVTYAYFVDSIRAHCRPNVINPRDHNQSVIANPPHPRLTARVPCLRDSAPDQHAYPAEGIGSSGDRIVGPTTS